MERGSRLKCRIGRQGLCVGLATAVRSVSTLAFFICPLEQNPLILLYYCYRIVSQERACPEHFEHLLSSQTILSPRNVSLICAIAWLHTSILAQIRGSIYDLSTRTLLGQTNPATHSTKLGLLPASFPARYASYDFLAILSRSVCPICSSTYHVQPDRVNLQGIMRVPQAEIVASMSRNERMDDDSRNVDSELTGDAGIYNRRRDPRPRR